MYYANGGFSWHDLYYMPIHLREFYWKQLLKAKEEEVKAAKKSAEASKSRVIRR